MTTLHGAPGSTSFGRIGTNDAKGGPSMATAARRRDHRHVPADIGCLRLANGFTLSSIHGSDPKTVMKE